MRNGSLFIITEAPGGIYNSEQLKRIALLADEDSAIVKVTEDQRLALFVDENRMDAIAGQLKEMGLGVRHYLDGLHQPTSCIGELCQDYQQDALQSALKVTEELAKIQLESSLKIGINGCHRCCVPCHTLDISVVGDEHGYRISIGGKGSQVAEMASFIAEGVPDAELPALIRKVVSLFQSNAEDGENLQDVIDRVGMGRFIEVLLPYSQDAAGEAEELFSHDSGEIAGGTDQDTAHAEVAAEAAEDTDDHVGIESDDEFDELEPVDEPAGFDETIEQQTQKGQKEAELGDDTLLESVDDLDELLPSDKSQDEQVSGLDDGELAESEALPADDSGGASLEDDLEVSESAELAQLDEDTVALETNSGVDESEPEEMTDEASSDLDLSEEDQALEEQEESVDLQDPDLEEEVEEVGSAFEERLTSDIEELGPVDGDEESTRARDEVIASVEQDEAEPSSDAVPSDTGSDPVAATLTLHKTKSSGGSQDCFSAFGIAEDGDYTVSFSSGVSFQFNESIVSDGPRDIEIGGSSLNISSEGGALVLTFTDGLKVSLPAKAA